MCVAEGELVYAFESQRQGGWVFGYKQNGDEEVSAQGWLPAAILVPLDLDLDAEEDTQSDRRRPANAGPPRQQPHSATGEASAGQNGRPARSVRDHNESASHEERRDVGRSFRDDWREAGGSRASQEARNGHESSRRIEHGRADERESWRGREDGAHQGRGRGKGSYDKGASDKGAAVKGGADENGGCGGKRDAGKGSKGSKGSKGAGKERR